MVSTRTLFFIFFALALILVLPRVFEPDLLRGQLGKQTFAAEMARSLERGEVQGIFPLRHFLEPFSPGVVPWAEEAPVYTGSVALGARLTGASIVIVGRCLSFVSWLAFLVALFRIGICFEKDLAQGRWLLPLLGILFPAGRIYATSVMPDLAMAAACAWAVVFVLDRKRLPAWFFCMLACLLKYYAAFFVFGLLLFEWTPKKWARRILFYGSATVPAVLYLAWFLWLKIPNPIVGYIAQDGHGHFGSLHFVLSLGFWARFVTWNLIKGPTVILGVLAVVGLGLALRSKTGYTRLCRGLSFSAFLFAVAFAHSYFVHDYYALQNAVLWALLAGFAFQRIFAERWIGTVVLIGAAILSQTLVYSATVAYPFYRQTADALERSAHGPGLFITERSGIASLYMAQITAWTVGPDQWEQFSNYREGTEALLKGNRIQWVGLLLADGDLNAKAAMYRERLAKTGWTEVELDHVMEPPGSRVPEARLILLTRAHPIKADQTP